MPHSAFLSLGSNIGDREGSLNHAIALLGEAGRVTSVSSFYDTEPVEFVQQPWFMNCAVALITELEPEDLLQSILAIERRMGRQRLHPKGPRTIDIDILLFDDLVVNSPTLTIPHPAMHQRRFVLEGLAEIAATAIHPVLNQTAGQLRDALPGRQAVEKRESGGSWISGDP